MNSEKYFYTDVTEIANGAFGTVLRAVQRDLEHKRPLRIVALKRLVEKAATERSITESNPAKEAVTLQLFDHDNIIKCYDIFELEAYYFLALEFAPVSLQALLHNSKIPMHAVRNLMWQLLTALSVLHERKVAHCDIKPHNLLIATSGKLKLADFGQATSNFEQLNNFGTRIYRAPEAILHGRWDTKVDIFAAGLVAIEMIAGRQLFAACSDVELIIQQNSLVGPFEGCRTLEASEDLHKIVLENGWERQQRLLNILREMCDEIGLIEMILSMLAPEPTDRLDAQSLLEHDWLSNGVAHDDFIERFMRYQDGPVVNGRTVCGVE